MHRGSRAVLTVGIVCAILVLSRSLQAQGSQAPKAEVTSLVSDDGVTPGGTMRVALHVQLPQGLHMNANTPRDPSLIAAVLAVDAPTGVSVAEIVYPNAIDLDQQGAAQPLAVYEREFVIGVLLNVDASVAPGDLRVFGRLRYQACDGRVCYFPATATTQWNVRVVPSGTLVTAQRSDVFKRIAFGTGQPPPRLAAAAATVAERRTDDPVGINRFTITGTTGGYLGRDDFLDFMRRAESGVQQRGWFEGRGLWAILGIVLIGGLALNLTPCVLPMIPINLAIIGAGAQAGSRRRGFLMGASYGAAMALVYGVLGLAVILTAGTFGTLNASPWFNLAIAAIFVVLALAMFDVVTIDFSRYSTRFNIGGTGRGTFAVAFGMGAVAALLAGACVAPVVIQVVLFSSNLYASGSASALALPFLLGVGMAIPWPLAGAGLSALPKPGVWKFQAENPDEPTVKAVMQRFGAIGLPTYAVLKPGS